MSFFRLFLLFLIISNLGWIIETLFFIVSFDVIADRGFLLLPLCPIYGCSLMVIYLIIGTPKEGKLKPLFERSEKLSPVRKTLSYIGLYCIYFIFATLIPTAAELLTGLFFDKCFGVKLWKYDKYKYNMNGYICLQFSLLWGFIITIAMNLLWPVIENMVRKISDKATKIIGISFLTIFIFDIVINIFYLVVTGKNLVLF